MSERCEPSPEWRHMRWHMLEADVEPLGWWPPKNAVWQAPAAWMGDTLGWSNDFGLGFDGPEEAAKKGWRYLAPVTDHTTVAALVEALEGMMVGCVWKDAHTFIDGTPIGAGWTTTRMPDAEAYTAARAALALYRGEAGR